MTATNKTTNYKLPQWVGTDNLSIMGDMNGAFTKIDELLKGFDDNIGVAKATATGASEISASSSVTAQSALQKATEALNKATEALQNALTGKAYIGKIILSNTLDTMDKVIAQYGGKRWSLIQDKFLLGGGGEYAVGTTGGNKSHTLTVEELPSHKHGMHAQMGNVKRGVGYYQTNAGGGTLWSLLSQGETGTTGTLEIENTGGNSPINMMPPFIAVYIWTCQEV